MFSPDGTRIVTASGDATSRVWDTETGRLRTTLQGHTGPVNSAVFSPDGARIVTASDDATAQLWDAETGRPLSMLQGHTGPVNSAAFSHFKDGPRIVTASSDRIARIYLVNAKDLLTLAACLVDRSLNDEDIARFQVPVQNQGELIFKHQCPPQFSWERQ